CLHQLTPDVARGDQRDHELVVLPATRQFTAPEQVAHLFERRLPRELGDIVSAVRETTIGAVEVAELRLGGDDAFEAADELGPFGHRSVLFSEGLRSGLTVA